MERRFERVEDDTLASRQAGAYRAVKSHASRRIGREAEVIMLNNRRLGQDNGQGRRLAGLGAVWISTMMPTFERGALLVLISTMVPTLERAPAHRLGVESDERLVDKALANGGGNGLHGNPRRLDGVERGFRITAVSVAGPI